MKAIILSTVLLLQLLHVVLSQSRFQPKSQAQFNPSILQDSRDLPKVDGSFGFLYRTEDGIAAAAKGNTDGVIQGRFSYTDPTGLKVNYNYQAGSRFTPGYTYDNNDNQPYDDGQYRPELYGEPQQYVQRPQKTQYVTRNDVANNKYNANY